MHNSKEWSHCCWISSSWSPGNINGAMAIPLLQRFKISRELCGGRPEAMQLYLLLLWKTDFVVTMPGN